MCQIRKAVIRALRDADMTFAELSIESGVSLAAIYRWLSPPPSLITKAENHTSTANLSRIMRALNLTIGYLPGGAPSAKILKKH